MATARALGFASVLGCATLLSACAEVGAPGDDGDGGVTAVPAPLSVVDDGVDRADRECLVVLREVRRTPDGPGYESDCSNGSCWYVWRALVDVAEEALDAGGQVAVLYHSGSDPTWWRAEAEGSVDGAPEGFERFLVRVFEHTVGPGMSMTSLMRTHIDLIPVVELPGGGRLFDHNRRTGDFENYELTADNTWAVGDDPSTCAAGPSPISVVRFLAGWTEEQRGAIVAGGRLRIEVDPARLTSCRASYTFAPAWDLEAQGRFLPGGQTFAGSAVSFETDEYGRRHDVVHPGALEVEVPADATAVEIWLRNWSGMSSPCESWDSDFGRNYRFDIDAAPPAPVAWAGDWGAALSRACERADGLPEPVEVDSYVIERACMELFADVYVPGVTDAAEQRPELVQAQVELGVDGAPQTVEWLAYVGRAGNNARYRWTLPRETLTRVEWSELRFAFRFSTDGVTWYRIAQAEGPGGGEARTVDRAFSRDGWGD